MPPRDESHLDRPMPRVAVVIPAYRAAAHIRRVIAGLPAWVSTIAVVDDVSPDDTGEIVRALAADDPRICLVTHDVNRGVGGAMLSGYDAALAAGAEIIVKMDSDDQMDPAYLDALVRPIWQGEADYVKANRFLHARELQAMPVVRRLGNIGLSFLTKLASGYWNVFDPTNGYTAIHASVVPLLRREAIDARYFFESSMLVELGLLRAVVKDVAVPARYADEHSSLSEWQALWRFPRLLLAAFLRRVLVQYFVRDFNASSLFLISGLIACLWGLIWGAARWSLSIRTGIPATTGTVMLAVLPLILGVQFLLQALVLDIQNVPTAPIQPRPGAPMPWEPGKG